MGVFEMQGMEYKKGFTLVELLVALVVTGIVLTAVAALAFAMNTATNSTDDISQKQAQLRFASLRIQELVRHSKLICSVSDYDVAVWRADDNNDGKINIGELVYIEAGPERDHIQLCEFPSSDSSVINIESIDAIATNWWSAYSGSVNYIQIVPQCSNVEFGFDELPPQSKFASITFELVENKISHQYQITAGVRSWAGNLLNEGDIVGDDD
jgi:prepilin-type N-terminal cleavage/methylation domain-containing protein